MAESNYGSTFTKGAAEVGKVIIVDFPELTTAKIDTTNHGTGGVTTSIPSKVVDAGDITLSILADADAFTTIQTDMNAQTIEECVISNPYDTITFSGYYLSAKEESADATSPDAVKISTTIAITGGIVVTATV